METKIYRFLFKLFNIVFSPDGYLCEYRKYFKRYSKKKHAYRHYILHGKVRGFDNGTHPSREMFDYKGYVELYNDVIDLNITPQILWEHYAKYGVYENRQPFKLNEFRPSNKEVLTLDFHLDDSKSVFFCKDIKTSEYSIIKNDAILIFLPERIGDIVACEPIARYLYLNYPSYELYWICKKNYYSLLKFNPFLKGVIVLDKLSDIYDIIYNLKCNHRILNCLFNEAPIDEEKGLSWHNSNLNITFRNYFVNNCLLSAFSCASGLPRLLVAPIFWTDTTEYDYHLPHKYIVVHCRSSAENKNWPEDKFQKLCDLLLDFIAVVEIGEEQTIKSLHNNFYDKTDVRDFHEINSIIKNSSGIVGVDSCFLHFANANSKKAVAILQRIDGIRRYKPYSGDYWFDKNIRYIFPELNKSVKDVEVETVFNACKDLELFT